MKAYYESRAQEYDEWWLGLGRFAERDRPEWDTSREELTRWIAKLPPALTLDVACGTGFLTRHLRGELVGLDQSVSMLEVARAQVPHATFVLGDALELPFGDGTFDRLFASYFYCHLVGAERARFLAEARRVARELVVVASVATEGEELERWEERLLNDGSRWDVFKRVFQPEDVAAELGGRVLHTNRYFVMVASHVR